MGVEVLLLKSTHKKRKESLSTPQVQVSLSTNEVPVNPSEDHPPNKAPALSLSAEAFKLDEGGGHQTVTYSLVIRVHSNLCQVGESSFFLQKIMLTLLIIIRFTTTTK